MERKTILITGCSTGIGAHCASAMKARGWRVFATARNDEDLAALEAEGLEARYLDYCEPQSIADTVKGVVDATGGTLDALFNNGAFAQPGAIEDLDDATIRAQFDSNFFGWHDLTRRIVPVMRKQGSGRIVQNSSVLGLAAFPHRGAYTATKFALEGYSSTLRLELAGTGISISVLNPGPIKSRITQNALIAFRKNIDIENSVHRVEYEKRITAMESGGTTVGQRGPRAVLKALVHACEHSRPRASYSITTPTRIADLARRLLPSTALNAFLARMSR
ncbi:MAG: SDR family oxidoreductase [Alphaproteobacteria bacterium]